MAVATDKNCSHERTTCQTELHRHRHAWQCQWNRTKHNTHKDTDKDALYENILASKSTLCEECIKQHDEINKLYKDSVNTLRLFTFITDQNDVVILNSIFKIGNGGVTDNFSSGSMYTFLNEEGKIIAPAIDQ